VDKLEDFDEHSKVFPGRSDLLIIKKHAYLIFQENTIRYANLLQRLQGKPGRLSARDLKIEGMPHCGSFFLRELPNIVFTEDYYTDEREIVSRHMSQAQREQHD